MKPLKIVSLSITLIIAGCTSNDKTGAGLEGNPNAPPAPAVSSDSHTQPAGQPDPGANGGFNLPASTPYQGNATVSQNVNPAPFLAASQSQGGTSSSQTPPTKPGLREKKSK